MVHVGKVLQAYLLHHFPDVEWTRGCCLVHWSNWHVSQGTGGSQWAKASPGPFQVRKNSRAQAPIPFSMHTAVAINWAPCMLELRRTWNSFLTFSWGRDTWFKTPSSVVVTETWQHYYGNKYSNDSKAPLSCSKFYGYFAQKLSLESWDVFRYVVWLWDDSEKLKPFPFPELREILLFLQVTVTVSWEPIWLNFVGKTRVISALNNLLFFTPLLFSHAKEVCHTSQYCWWRAESKGQSFLGGIGLAFKQNRNVKLRAKTYIKFVNAAFGFPPGSTRREEGI